MALKPCTDTQIPDHAILDQYNKQTYLGNSYIIPSGAVTVTTAETPILLITNPASNTKSVFVNLRRYSSTVEPVLIKSYINATVATTGTAATPVNLRTGSPFTSSSVSYVNGQFTVSANGTLLSAIGSPATYFVTIDNNLLVVLDPGKNLLVTGAATTSTTVVNADASWYEI